MRITVKTLLVSIAKKIGYVIATCIIIAAVFVSVSYLLTPFLDKHRTDLEKWASDLLQTPVTISKVEIAWYRYQPEISLNEVTILNKNTKEPILQIQKVRVFFSIPQSIWQGKLIPSGIMISGTDINLRQSSAGEISVQGFPIFGGNNRKPYQKETKVTDLLGWLSVQPRLILQDINVRYVGFKEKNRFVTLYNLSLENSGQGHLLLGKALLHQEIPTEVNLALQWVGNSVELKNIKAKIYLYVSGFSVSQWLKDFSWNKWQITRGIASAKIWATWNDGKFTKIQSTFQLYGLDLYSETDKQTHTVNRLSGNVGLKREGDNYILAGDDLLLDLPSHLWPVNSFYISLAPDANGKLFPKVVNLGYVDLKDVQSFLFSTSWLTPDTRQALSKLQPNGSFLGVNMLFSGAWDDFRHISFNGNFSQLDFLPWQKFPGVRNLSGKIKWDGTGGDLSLDSTQIAIQYDSIFAKPIILDQVTADSQFTIDQNNGWAATILALHILNGDMSCDISGKLTSQPNMIPIADLNANFTLQKVSHISRYLPTRILDPDLVKWLQDAFLSGEIKNATMVLKGPLNDFPFDQGNGTFLVSGTLNDINLHYAPDWPNLEHVNGKISFAGHRMTTDIDRAEIFNVPIGPVHAEINDLGSSTKSPILEVQESEISMDLAQGLRFLNHSPLEKTVGKMFSGVEMHGPMLLKLGLTVPLSDPDKTQIKGNIDLKDGQMNLAPWGLRLNHLKGQFQFTESTTTAQNIQGQLFNKPFELSLTTLEKSKDISVLRANLKNNFSILDLEHWLKIPFSKVAQGSLNANMDIDFSLNAPITVHLSSNLVGLAIDLPDQYGKKSNETRDFSTDIILPVQQEPLRVKIGYGNLFSAAMTLNRKKEEFKLIGVNLKLGAGTPTWPDDSGLSITGDFDELDGEKITKYLNQSDKNNFSGLQLRDIDIHTNVLNIFGQRLSDVRLQASPSQHDWILNITSPDVVGQIKAPTHLTSQSLISAQFQKLKLQSVISSNLPTVNVKSLPSVSLVANNVSYDNMVLGQVTLKASAIPSGWNVQTLHILSSRMDLQAAGNWTENDTQLQGRVSSQRVSDLVNGFGFDVHNFVAGDAYLNFDLSWDGALFAPTLASMNGRASLNIGSGRIVDIGAAGGAKMDLGRMLSIFSLQSIPRRLSLDFSDVFQKGYSFDSVKGDFSLQNGNAYTNNLRFNGPLAGVFINGRIGFKNKDYDLILSITPYVSSVTSGLPVAATIIGGPVGGVAALAVNTVLGSAVSKAATFSYAVRGPWNNPNWISVSNARR